MIMWSHSLYGISDSSAFCQERPAEFRPSGSNPRRVFFARMSNGLRVFCYNQRSPRCRQRLTAIDAAEACSISNALYKLKANSRSGRECFMRFKLSTVYVSALLVALWGSTLPCSGAIVPMSISESLTASTSRIFAGTVTNSLLESGNIGVRRSYSGGDPPRNSSEFASASRTMTVFPEGLLLTASVDAYGDGGRLDYGAGRASSSIEFTFSSDGAPFSFFAHGNAGMNSIGANLADLYYCFYSGNDSLECRKAVGTPFEAGIIHEDKTYHLQAGVYRLTVSLNTSAAKFIDYSGDALVNFHFAIGNVPEPCFASYLNAVLLIGVCQAWRKKRCRNASCARLGRAAKQTNGVSND